MNQIHSENLNKEVLLRFIASFSFLNNGLMSGTTGRLVFYSSMSNLVYSNELKEDISKVQNNISSLKGYNLANGLAGFALAVHFIYSKYGVLNFDESMILEINDVLNEGLIIACKEGNSDYLHGYLGIINALLYIEKPNNLIGEILNNLCKRTLLLNSKLPNEFQEINLSLSHGIPSLLSVLVNFDKRNPNKLISQNIEKLIEFIQSFRNTSMDAISQYPSIVKGKNSGNLNSRLAWCYGDLGVNLSLLKAAIHLKNKKLETDLVIDLIATSCRRTLIETTIMDNCFCHGASGLLFYYKKLFQKYGHVEFKEAYEYWQNQIVEQYRNSGIKSIISVHTQSGPKLEYGLLEGLLGVYYALFSEDFDTRIIDYIFLTNLEE